MQQLIASRISQHLVKLFSFLVCWLLPPSPLHGVFRAELFAVWIYFDHAKIKSVPGWHHAQWWMQKHPRMKCCCCTHKVCVTNRYKYQRSTHTVAKLHTVQTDVTKSDDKKAKITAIRRSSRRRHCSWIADFRWTAASAVLWSYTLFRKLRENWTRTE